MFCTKTSPSELNNNGDANCVLFLRTVLSSNVILDGKQTANPKMGVNLINFRNSFCLTS